jgi:hypothetical protein
MRVGVVPERLEQRFMQVAEVTRAIATSIFVATIAFVAFYFGGSLGCGC